MVEKFMYNRIEPKVAGAKYETVSGQVVVGGIDALDWIDNDLNVPHRRAIFAHTHIQTSLNQAQFFFILSILLADPLIFPFQIVLKSVSFKNFGQ